AATTAATTATATATATVAVKYLLADTINLCAFFGTDNHNQGYNGTCRYSYIYTYTYTYTCACKSISANTG
ncbi:MAG: hypothetical protein IIZ54_11350, partial [Selenomonadaceae bacterium]|nr:hypothetical protein [Selenomonadaceae bacterium]